MTAVDTNIVVRLLTDDHAQQTAAARSLFAAGPIWIGRTVLLEVDWVLQSVYNFDKADVCAAFSRLLGLGNVHTDDKASVANAITLTLAGLEFADALHLTARPAGAAFASFDEKFVRRATRAGITEIFSA
jgi:predicted nucleic-acid-binding protein